MDTAEPEGKLAKLPPPHANQQLKDRATMIATELKVTEFYHKNKKIYAAKLKEQEDEVVRRNENLSKELAKAEEDYKARVAAIRTQHQLHMEETLAKKKASEDKMQKLEEQFTAKKAMYAEVIGLTVHDDKPAPTPLQQLAATVPDTDARLRKALEGIRDDQIQIIKEIFNVPAAMQGGMHLRPPPGVGEGTAVGARALPAVPDDGVTGELGQRDHVMNEGEQHLDGKKPRL